MKRIAAGHYVSDEYVARKEASGWVLRHNGTFLGQHKMLSVIRDMIILYDDIKRHCGGTEK
jgi:hypothetical protein